MSLVRQLRQDYPQFKIHKGERFTWVPARQLIYYKALDSQTDYWSLFHELGHALLEHREFTSDMALLVMEVEAWAQAEKLAKKYGQPIDWRHIEHCLDSYRDWLHARSTCPTCQMVTWQLNQTTYQCFNCQTRWQVTKSRLCRPHRRQVKQKQLPV